MYYAGRAIHQGSRHALRLHNDDGKGLTVEDIEAEVEELRSSDLPGEIEQAHFMASRYPRPEPKTPTEEASPN
jgi:hypothetical protein